ncbi:TPA: DUF1492 domain-containing protein [Streptococcus suis]
MILVRKLAKRKLKEFPRWCRVAVLKRDLIQVEKDWTVKLFEFDPEDYKGRIHTWQREAPYEANEILKAINAIQTPRLRAILIMSYIVPDKLKVKEQVLQLDIAESTYYLAKNEALKEFASCYRNGSLQRHGGG